MQRVKTPTIILLFTMFIASHTLHAVEAPSNFSAYLIGNWESRQQFRTHLTVINPTNGYLKIVIACYDHQENLLWCDWPDELSPYDLYDVQIPTQDFSPAVRGVIRIISFTGDPNNPDTSLKIKTGIVAYQMKFVPRPVFVATETLLAAVPIDFINIDLLRDLHKDCGDLTSSKKSHKKDKPKKVPAKKK
ncbi:MAG: hypothetical protein PVH61_22250 [Candidatus Aminicenantes bacterium]|jgi:hypothetical protein